MTTGVIAGWAHTPFGRSEAEDVEALMAEVSGTALSHAGISADDVDGIFVGSLNSGFSKQGFEGAQVALGVPTLAHCPAVHLENACASGSAALYTAMDFIGAGRGKVALVVGAEKMTAASLAQTSDVLLSACYRKEESDVDGGFAGIFGQIAQAYFQYYGDCSEEIGIIAAKNHKNGVSNPYAHMKKDLGVEFCTTVSDKNPYVAGPLRRTDCSMISDGAAAIVLVADDLIADVPRAIGFRAQSQVNDILPLSRRKPTAFEGTRRAWQQARETAGIAMTDLDLVETHDCFTIAELIEYEAMGLAEPGKGSELVRSGYTQKDGALPVNPSGGLKAKGHPIGATGVSQHIMASLQLMGEAGGMQIEGAKLAGVHNMGGAAVANYVSVLERRK